MRAALELGRWTFPAPLGYLNAPKWSSASLVHDPERAALVKQVFEDLATGRFTKQEVMARATDAGLRTRGSDGFHRRASARCCVTRSTSARSMPGVRRLDAGQLEALVNEPTFYRAQAVPDGRVSMVCVRAAESSGLPVARFRPLRHCGRPLTGSWSKGRNGRYAYYHCQRRCRAVNVNKAALEGVFVDELALLQPTAGYMRLVRDRVLYVWEQVTPRREGPSRRAGAPGQGHPAEARPARRSISLRGNDRPEELWAPT